MNGDGGSVPGLDDLRIENIRTVDDDFDDVTSREMFKSIDQR